MRLFDLGIITTPLAETAVRALDADGGVMVTASHNPIEHNGFKFLTGCSAEADGSAPPGALLSARAMAEVIACVRELANGSDARVREACRGAITPEALDKALSDPENEHARVKAERAYLDVIGEDWGIAPHCLKPLTLGPGAARPQRRRGLRDRRERSGALRRPRDRDQRRAGLPRARHRHRRHRPRQRQAHASASGEGRGEKRRAFRSGVRLRRRPRQSGAAGSRRVRDHPSAARRHVQYRAGACPQEAAGSSTASRSRSSRPMRRRLPATGSPRRSARRSSRSRPARSTSSPRCSALRLAGYDVPVGVEGANGGTIFESATCRDGLQVALSAAQAESMPEVACEWMRIVSGLNGCRFDGSHRVTLRELVDSVPVNPNVMLKLSSPPMSHGEVKRRMEEHFREDRVAGSRARGSSATSSRTSRRPRWSRAHRRRERRLAGDAPRSRPRARSSSCRGSRTESGVWRMIIDADSPDDFEPVCAAARAMFEQATGAPS